MGQLIDHLWQSCMVVGVIWALSWLVAPNPAALRLWLWRIAAMKFLLPFSLLYSLGGWIGFPVRHVAIPPPAGLIGAVDSVMGWTAPMQTFAPRGGTLIGGLLLVAGITALCTWAIAGELRLVARQRNAETARADRGAQEPPPLGMFKSTALAGAALCGLAAPTLAGAVHDRLYRQEALDSDIESLREATVVLTEATWRFGDHSSIVAGPGSVSIRKINLQDLVAMVYGIGQFEVFGGALPWLESPHYDVQITGPLHAPGVFDPYSLRQPVTKYLYDQYGVSIRVNGNCQEPCLNQESFVVERLPWKLAEMISGSR